MPEDRRSISPSRIAAVDVTRRSFTVVRRGFDEKEVKSFLDTVEREVHRLEEREQELIAKIDELEERVRNPEIDEATLSSALGHYSGQVLRNAHEEAARVLREAEEAAAALIREAQEQANETQIRAESAAAEKVAAADLMAASATRETSEEVAAIRDAARVERETILEEARDQGKEMVEQARDARKRVMADMAERRRALQLQIEQFRAARDELAAAVMGVRDTVDQVVNDLVHTDEQAREAARQAALRPVDVEEVAPLDVPYDLEIAEATDGSPTFSETNDIELPTVERSATHEREPLTDTDVGTDPGADPGAGAGTDAELPSVEQLFARIRSGSPDPVEVAEDVEEEEVEVAIAGDLKEGDGAGESGVDLGAGQLLAGRRSALVDPIVQKLARRLKRVLQDDQNALLDRIRSGSFDSEEFASLEPEQRLKYVEASAKHLCDAFVAGVEFTRDVGAARRGSDGPGAGAAEKASAPMAEEFAAQLVTQLRRRIFETDGSTAGSTGDETAERVGAAYRELRGERVERLAGDFVLGAFSSGVLAASEGGGVRWQPTGEATPCPDCDDNSLADLVKPGGEFPTGHRHPPAHPGCRCLLAPAPL